VGVDPRTLPATSRNSNKMRLWAASWGTGADNVQNLSHFQD
jgi:hypothetical protein